MFPTIGHSAPAPHVTGPVVPSMHSIASLTEQAAALKTSCIVRSAASGIGFFSTGVLLDHGCITLLNGEKAMGIGFSSASAVVALTSLAGAISTISRVGQYGRVMGLLAEAKQQLQAAALARTAAYPHIHPGPHNV